MEKANKIHPFWPPGTETFDEFMQLAPLLRINCVPEFLALEDDDYWTQTASALTAHEINDLKVGVALITRKAAALENSPKKSTKKTKKKMRTRTRGGVGVATKISKKKTKRKACEDDDEDSDEDMDEDDDDTEEIPEFDDTKEIPVALESENKKVIKYCDGKGCRIHDNSFRGHPLTMMIRGTGVASALDFILVQAQGVGTTTFDESKDKSVMCLGEVKVTFFIGLHVTNFTAIQNRRILQVPGLEVQYTKNDMHPSAASGLVPRQCPVFSVPRSCFADDWLAQFGTAQRIPLRRWIKLDGPFAVKLEIPCRFKPTHVSTSFSSTISRMALPVANKKEASDNRRLQKVGWLAIESKTLREVDLGNWFPREKQKWDNKYYKKGQKWFSELLGTVEGRKLKDDWAKMAEGDFKTHSHEYTFPCGYSSGDSPEQAVDRACLATRDLGVLVGKVILIRYRDEETPTVFWWHGVIVLGFNLGQVICWFMDDIGFGERGYVQSFRWCHAVKQGSVRLLLG